MSRRLRRGAQRRKHEDAAAPAPVAPSPVALSASEAEQVLAIASTNIGAYRARANLLGGARPETIAEIVAGRFFAADGSWTMDAYAVVRRRKAS